MHFYKSLTVVSLSNIKLSKGKKSIQRTTDGLRGVLVLNVSEVLNVFSNHWCSQECILFYWRPELVLIALSKAQQAKMELTVLSPW